MNKRISPTCPNCKRVVDRLHEIIIEAHESRISILRCEECKEAGLKMLEEKIGHALHN